MMIETDLFGRVVLVRNRGRISMNKQQKVNAFAGEFKTHLPSRKRRGC
jgi:hypothetical protein